MTSWEQVINEVVIPGDPGKILNAKGKWELALAGIADAKRYLDDGLIDLATWEGAAGDAYRTSIGEIAKKLRTLTEDYESMPTTLQTAATQLADIRSQIPVPDSMIDDVGGASLLFANTGVLQTLAAGDIFNSLKADFSVDGLRDGMGNVLHGLGSVASHIPGIGGHAQSALDGLRDWVSTQDDEAVRLYNQLNGDYAGTAANVPAGSYVPGSRDLNMNEIPLGDMPGGGFSGGMPGTGGLGGMPTTGFDPTVGTSGIGGLDPNGFDTPGTDDFGPGGFGNGDLGTDLGGSELPSTGLAGAGPGGLTGLGSGAGLGGGGLGGLGSSGLGGGLGSGGVGGAGRFPGMGTPVTPMMPMGGMAGGAGAGGGRSGARGAGSRSAAGRTGMMGVGPHGGAGQGSEEDHGTWLQEDEDVWGADNNASPPLLT